MRFYVFSALLIAACGYALVRGGKPERLTALIFIAADIATVVVMTTAFDNYRSVDWLTFAIDALTLCGMFAVALSTPNRTWPLWMTALQLPGTLSHLVRAFSSDVMNWIYYILTAGWAYPMVALLAVATWRHRQRLAHPNVALFSPASWARAKAARLLR